MKWFFLLIVAISLNGCSQLDFVHFSVRFSQSFDLQTVIAFCNGVFKPIAESYNRLQVKILRNSHPKNIQSRAQNSSWVKEQIEQDLKNTSLGSIKTACLKRYFKQLDDRSAQALYGTIRGNKIVWTSSRRVDHWRNSHVFKYFKNFLKRHSLPDMDFILLTDDGCVDRMEFPVFSFSSFAGKNTCLFPDFEMLQEANAAIKNPKDDVVLLYRSMGDRHPWDTKRPQAFFRGGDAGKVVDDMTGDFGNTRMRAIFFSAAFPSLLDASLTAIRHPPMLEAYKQLGKTLCRAEIETHFYYKYLLDVDGHANTYSRCRWILLSNSVLLKVGSSYSQWYYRAMKPWVHYVPVREDLSDLQEALDRCIANDDLAYEIANRGRTLGSEIFSSHAVENYIVQLLREYAKRIIISD